MGSSPSCESADKDTKMPLFKNRQSVEAKKRYEHKIYLAKERPDSAYDISECEISEVGHGTFSLCKVLHKEALLLNNNWLSSLNSGGNLVDLSSCIRVLDLHDNEFATLPDDIGKLKSLQVLNVENNKLKKLPDSIGELHNLQTLNLRCNKLKNLPTTICSMQSLRNLDISENHITSLPLELCRVRTLETLTLDVDRMHIPPKENCRNGTIAIMKYLCEATHTEYIPPSKVLLNVLEVPKGVPSSTSGHSLRALQIENEVQEALMEQYQFSKQKKKADTLLLEKQIENEQRQQAHLTAVAKSQKQNILTEISKGQDKLDNDLNVLQLQKELNRKDMIDKLYEAERNASNLTQHILEMNEKHRKREETMDKMEKERIKAEEWFKVRQEEEALLRKQEVIAAMEKVISESEMFERIRLNYVYNTNEAAKRALNDECMVDGALSELLLNRDVDKSELVKSLHDEEEMQRNAFIALQLQKDSKHHRVSKQIELIQQELSQLTLLEVEKRDQKFQNEKNILEDKRQALSLLLLQLMRERDKREQELRNRLNEMESQRQDDQKDYWLIQYQRLMDRKPKALMDVEKMLEISVVKILEQSNAGEYIPHFARHRITIETMLQLTDAELRQIGVHELGLRKTILQRIRDFVDTEKKENKLNDLDSDKLKEEEGASAPEPTAPPDTESLITARITTECVICMENESNVVFLMCGHVCCCAECAEPVKQCPLCRTVITQRVWLSQTTDGDSDQ
ncbi:E3 ubiquitin-protein ligase LRSAM1-like [Tubulanus polymorphus]|uniref:E3 ubiquitin-protein ligase LRSAM1-like n=1 Tax=Tubulanus polymorphus TaxID=672921 RepID=UPI003DA402C9